MSKKLLLACLSVLFSLHATSQSLEKTVNNGVTVERSMPFREPEGSGSNLLLMKNGNTLLFTFTADEGINVTVFDPQHRARPVVNSRVTSWNNKLMERSTLEHLSEINDQAVAFLQVTQKKNEALYRFTFDGKSGKLIEEKRIAELSNDNKRESASFVVKKAPDTEHYAILMQKNKAGRDGDLLRIIHYSPQHQVISDANFDIPENKYKNANYMNMYVNGDKSVFLLSAIYNETKSDIEDSRYVIAHLTKGAKEFKSKVLDFTNELKLFNSAVKYNPANNCFYMLSPIYVKKDQGQHLMSRRVNEKYKLMISVIDGETLNIKQRDFITHTGLDKYVQERQKDKQRYEGLIQDFNLDEDGAIQLLMEEVHVSTETTMDKPNRPGLPYLSTHLGKIGVVQLTANLKEINSYTVSKSQQFLGEATNFDLNKRYQSGRNFRGGFMNDRNTMGFYSFDFFNVNNKNFIIYNDYPENDEVGNKRRKDKKAVKSISTTNTICAVVDGKNVTRSYLFGDPGKKDESRFCKVEMITKHPDGKSFATMMIERKGRDKKAHIVWVVF